MLKNRTIKINAASILTHIPGLFTHHKRKYYCSCFLLTPFSIIYVDIFELHTYGLIEIMNDDVLILPFYVYTYDLGNLLFVISVIKSE